MLYPEFKKHVKTLKAYSKKTSTLSQHGVHFEAGDWLEDGFVKLLAGYFENGELLSEWVWAQNFGKGNKVSTKTIYKQLTSLPDDDVLFNRDFGTWRMADYPPNVIAKPRREL